MKVINGRGTDSTLCLANRVKVLSLQIPVTTSAVVSPYQSVTEVLWMFSPSELAKASNEPKYCGIGFAPRMFLCSRDYFPMLSKQEMIPRNHCCNCFFAVNGHCGRNGISHLQLHSTAGFLWLTRKKEALSILSSNICILKHIRTCWSLDLNITKLRIQILITTTIFQLQLHNTAVTQ